MKRGVVYLKSPEARRAFLAVAFVLLAALGLLAGRLWAASSFGLEAESSSLNNAVSFADSSASGGRAIQFEAAVQPGTTASSVSQYGITWSFDRAYPVGQFANGDWWVVGPVTITSMSPAYTSGRNGWEANPNSGTAQGLDNRLDGFQASRVPSLPYTAQSNTSIIKGISRSGNCGNDGSNHYPCLTTAAVLTVLSSVPAGNGAQMFRPPYFGSAKPLYTTTQLQTSLLPSLAPVGNPPSLNSVARRYQRVQADHVNNWTGRYMHASENYARQDNPSNENVSEYGSEIAHDADETALRLMLNDSLSAKMPALINYVQAGIDFYGMHNGGMSWYSDGGHMQGRKVVAVFAAVMLNDAAMKSEIANAPYASYGDDGHVYNSTNQATISALAARGYGPALYGQNCDSGMYELRQSSGYSRGPGDCRDPIGMIDGGDAPGDSYQFCCLAKPMKGASLAARLLPGGRAAWNYDPFHQYVDRWVGFGAWATPDNWNSLGRSPARNYASTHGTGRDAGWYSSSFVDAMWSAYRSQAQ